MRRQSYRNKASEHAEDQTVVISICSASVVSGSPCQPFIHCLPVLGLQEGDLKRPEGSLRR
jgi:hypothetical protein